MSDIEWYVYWVVVCGLAANLWLALKVGKFFGHFLYAAAAAASFTRLAWACGREHGFKPHLFPQWMYTPAVWFSFFCTSLGAGAVSHMGGAGDGSGIGKWTVFPKKEAN